MNGSPELLEFYLVEATEYLDSLDRIVSGTGGAPDGNAFIATARALRGASSMAQVEPIADIAAAIEQIAHGVRDGDIRWTLDLDGVLKLTVNDLRFLVRGVRTWGERESARAQARRADLQRFLPSATSRQATPEAAATAPVFIALQSSAIAAELDAFVANPRHRRALDDALTRARTMRGIAGIGDFPPLADVADAVDRTARSLMPDAPLAETEVELFRSAAEVLRQTSARLRDGDGPLADAPEAARFARAVQALFSAPTRDSTDRVVPIDELFYADKGPHVVQRSEAPPTTRIERFREEIVVRAEHVRRLIDDARRARDPAGSDRAARSLQVALRDLRGAAESFEVRQIATFFGEAAAEVDVLAPPVLEALEAGALLLITPASSVEEVEQRLSVLERARRVTPVVNAVIPPPDAGAAPAAPAAAPAAATVDATIDTAADVPIEARVKPPAAPTPERSVTPAAATASPPPSMPLRGIGGRRAPATPTGRELQSLLQKGIEGFSLLDDEPLSEPARLDEDDIVPIESLVFRGQSAIRRAIEVRDAMRASGRTDDANLQEIFDLLDLAQAE